MTKHYLVEYYEFTADGIPHKKIIDTPTLSAAILTGNNLNKLYTIAILYDESEE